MKVTLYVVIYTKNKNTNDWSQSTPRSTSSYYKVDWLSSYFHACHDEITYFNRGVFPIRLPWHGRVVDAGQIFFFLRQNYVTYITK